MFNKGITMSVWRNIISFMSGGASRNIGQQSSGPGSYAEPAAVSVTLDTALQLSAVWACTKIITESISSLPINFYTKNKDGTRTILTDHPLPRLFGGKVNKWQTRQEFMECITYQLALQGNNYSAIQRNNKGDIISLVPLMTPQMTVSLQEDGDIQYQYQDGGGMRVYAQKSIWHNKIFGNGIVGLSPIAYARNSIGIAQAAESSTTKIYKNGGKPSGILMIDRVLKDEQRESIKANFSELTDGNSDRLFVLEANMEFKQVSLSPQDIELLASRHFQIEDIARFWGVPSVLINDASASTAWGSGIQEIVQGFYKFGLRPYIERYKSSMISNLLTAEERATIDIDFDLDALLQPSRADRVKTGKEGITGGMITPNEYRKSEGMQPLEGGDSLIVQQQMIPLEQIKDIPRTGDAKQEDTDNTATTKL